MERGLGRRTLEGGVIGALGQVDRVVGGQLIVAARGGGDAGLGGASRRGRVGVWRGGRGRGGIRVARDGEDGLAARVVVGLAIEVDAGGADLDTGGHGVRALGQQCAEVHVFDRGTQCTIEVLARAIAVDGCQAGNVHVQVADRGDGLGVEGDGAGRQGRSVHVLPFALADPVLQGLDGRLRLVAAHGGQRVDEAVAAEFLAILGRFQARVFHGGLLAHEVGDLLALESRVDRLNERGDARDVGRGHGGAAGLGVAGGEDRRGYGRVDVLARSGEVDALAVVGEVGALEVRPLGLGLDVGARGGTDLADALDHGGDLHAVLHGAVLDRGVEVGRRPAVGRDVVVVHAVVARRSDDGQPLALRVCDGAGRGLEAGGLLGIARAPVDPGIHRVGVVDDVDAVAGGPHEAASHVLGVHELLVVGGLDGHEGRGRRDAIDADAVVVGGDDARDVCAMEVVVTPRPVGLRRDAVVPTGDGTGGVDAPHEVGVRVVDAGVDDADRDGRVRDRHSRGVGGTHRLGSPVDDLLGFIGLSRTLSAQGGRATRLRSRLCARLGSGLSRARLAGLRGRLWVGSGLALPLGHGGDARRAHRVHGNSGLRQGCGQVRGERGRLTLGKERPELRVGGQRDATGGCDQRGRAREVLSAGLRAEVDGVVHQAGAGASGRDEAGMIVGPGGWGGRCGHAHGQGEGGDKPDACNIAAHGSSTFSCGSGEYDNVPIRTIML